VGTVDSRVAVVTTAVIVVAGEEEIATEVE
jgi:hypothetical protein